MRTKSPRIEPGPRVFHFNKPYSSTPSTNVIGYLHVTTIQWLEMKPKKPKPKSLTHYLQGLVLKTLSKCVEESLAYRWTSAG